MKTNISSRYTKIVDRVAETIKIMKKLDSSRDYTALENYLLSKSTFLSDPASTRYHGAYKGGLAEHSLMVMDSLLELTKKLRLKWENPASPYLIGLCHDICKIGQYALNDRGTYDWSSDEPLGHGEKSVMRLMWVFPKLTAEEVYCIRWHMGAFDESSTNRNNYGCSIEKYPNVLWTHTADMMASRIKKV